MAERLAFILISLFKGFIQILDSIPTIVLQFISVYKAIE